MKSIYYLSLVFFTASIVVSCQSTKAEESIEVANDLDGTTESPEASTDLLPGWINFSNEDGGFSIQMPGTPQQSSVIEPTEVGDILIEMFMYEESVTKIYIVGYNDYPSELFADATAKETRQTLDDVLMGATSAVGLDIVEEEKMLDLDGVMGKMIKAKSSTNGYHAHYKAYMVNNRLYQIGIIRDGSYPMDEKSEKFFGSFTLDK